MNFSVSSLLNRYNSIFVYFKKQSYAKIPDSHIPEGFKRGSIGSRMKIDVLFAVGKIDTLNMEFPGSLPDNVMAVTQYQPVLDLTFYTWIID